MIMSYRTQCKTRSDSLLTLPIHPLSLEIPETSKMKISSVRKFKFIAQNTAKFHPQFKINSEK